eukprot:746545-Hanusia_phi.AAC.6
MRGHASKDSLSLIDQPKPSAAVSVMSTLTEAAVGSCTHSSVTLGRSAKSEPTSNDHGREGHARDGRSVSVVL